MYSEFYELIHGNKYKEIFQVYLNNSPVRRAVCEDNPGIY